MNAILLQVAMISSALCGQSPEKIQPDFEERDGLVDSINDFGIAIYNDLRKNNETIAISPPSISTVLTVLLAGSKGDTAKEISKALRLNLPQDRVHENYKRILESYAAEKNSELGDQELTVANSLWIQDGFPIKAEYKDLVTRNYGALIYSLDFKNRDESGRRINEWVADKTAKKIPAFMAPNDIDARTRMVAVNTVYLNYSWSFPFREADTKKNWFYLGKTKKELFFMHGEIPCRYYSDEGISMLEITYRHLKNPMSMFIMLPNSADEFSQMENKLTSKKLREWQKKSRGYMTSLSMPKIKIDSRNYLRKSLESMGLLSAFGPNADFSGIARHGIQSLQLKDVIHQTYFCADEKGTEAAAATAMILRTPYTSKHIPPPHIYFEANRPFLFLVRDNMTGLVLFFGRFGE